MTKTPRAPTTATAGLTAELDTTALANAAPAEAPIVLPLDYPITTAAGVQLTQLTFHRLTFGQFNATQDSYPRADEELMVMHLLPLATGISDADLDLLDGADAVAATELIATHLLGGDSDDAPPDVSARCVPLRYPLVVSTTDVPLTRLTFRRPTRGDIKAAKQQTQGKKSAYNPLLIARLTDVLPEDLEGLDAADALTVLTFLQALLRRSQLPLAR